MKTRLILILAIAALTISTSINANPSFPVEKTYDLAGTVVKITSEAKSIIVNLGNVKGDEVTILIEDAEGNQFINEKVRDQSFFARKYNVSKLEKGGYRLIVTKKTSKTVQPFELTDEGVQILDTEKRETYIPVVNQENNKLDVNVLMTKVSNITINLYDNEGRKVMEDKNYVVLNLHKRYDISKMTNGVYVAEVVAGDETFYYTITK